MYSVLNLIHYYKDCYQYDMKAVKVPHFFSKNVENNYVVPSWELLEGRRNQHFVNTEWATETDENLLLYADEKILVSGTFFLKGKMNILGRNSSVFPPLYLHEVNLNCEDDIYSIQLNTENPIINPSFLDYANSHSRGMNVSYDELVSALPKGIFSYGELVELEQVLKKLFPSIDIGCLEDCMKTECISADLNKIRSHKSEFDDNMKLIGGMALGLIPKAKGSRGVINELQKMSERGDCSSVITSLFFPPKTLVKKENQRTIMSPFTLSESQKNIFHSLEHYTLSLVIGPPGTGKSFTVAALTTDLISQGKSVLIASKNSQAGKVIAEKIEQDFGLKGIVTKASEKTHQNQLKRRLKNISLGIGVKKVRQDELKELEEEINLLAQTFKRQQGNFKLIEKKELKRGQFLQKYKKGFLSNLRKRWLQRTIKREQPIWEKQKALIHTEELMNQKIKQFIQLSYDFHLYKVLSQKREEITHLIKALEAEIGSLTQSYFEKVNFSAMLTALPAWICNTTDIHSVLPLKKEMFDVLIIDEATQCDIPSALPLFQRAKKVVIVGDPKQLRHISFLSQQQQEELYQKHDLSALPHTRINYRKNSILDLVNQSITTQEQVVFLDEHYRSMPEIIQFSNRKFYEEQLHIMTSVPSTKGRKSVFVHQINGTRNNKGENPKEADAILQKILEIEAEEDKINAKMSQSIGVLSPFRSQVSLLKRMISKELPLRVIRKHRILVGTPFEFQGEEKDVMLLSFTVDENTHPSTYLYLNREDVFNVSITRARVQQHVYISVDKQHLKDNYLLSQYLNDLKSSLPIRIDTEFNNAIKDKFLEEVKFYLDSLAVDEIITNYQIAGVQVDIVVVHQERTYCIDLVGFPGGFANQISLEHCSVLARIGIPVFFLSYSAWLLQEENSKKNIYQFLS